MSIKIFDESTSERFARGDVVFKITSFEGNTPGREGDIPYKEGDIPYKEGDIPYKEYRMVTTKDDSEEKAYTHIYIPLLFLVDLPTRLAYLYGCLNHNFKRSRKDIYIFWWRKIGTNEWKKWFGVYPYEDIVYKKSD